jgi:hypothetical protein
VCERDELEREGGVLGREGRGQEGRGVTGSGGRGWGEGAVQTVRRVRV